MNFKNITDYVEITPDQVDAARAAGLMIHHELTEELLHYGGGESGYVTTRDEWFAAAPEWVDRYWQSGGLWAYRD